MEQSFPQASAPQRTMFLGRCSRFPRSLPARSVVAREYECVVDVAIGVWGFFSSLLKIPENIVINEVHRYDMSLFPWSVCRNKLQKN